MIPTSPWHPSASLRGAVGGGLGWLAEIGVLAIPGAGPLIAAGPIMAALSGAAAGAMVGGITGTLIGLGIPELRTPAPVTLATPKTLL